MDFVKMEGAGNDFIMIDCLKDNITLEHDIIQFLCNRKFGIGADGIIFVKKSLDADCFMDIWNSDGTQAKMCGNGIRCVAKFMSDFHSSKMQFSIETLSGIKTVILCGKGSSIMATTNMGKPSFSPEKLPMITDYSTTLNHYVGFGNENFCMHGVSMGNPHAVIPVDDLFSTDIENIAKKIQLLPTFPDGVNVEFVKKLSPSELSIRFFERGVGETLACGTGTCATVSALFATRFCEKNVQIHTAGGDLYTRMEDNGDIFLTGPCSTVFCGKTEPFEVFKSISRD